MNAPEERSWTDRTGNHGRAVEDMLTVLQDSHRLGIHMVEKQPGIFECERTTLNEMRDSKCENIEAALCSKHPRLFSMSLLPSTASNCSLVPYEVKYGSLHNYGYMVDLSQQQPNPPRTVRVSPRNLSSDNDNDNKNFALNQLSTSAQKNQFNAQLEDLYRSIANFHEPWISSEDDRYDHHDQMARWRDEICKALGGPEGGELSDQQLDALGDHIINQRHSFTDEKGAWNDGIIPEVNEILVACHERHLKAITIPSFHGLCDVPKNIYDARIRLQGALVGLSHLDAGVDLPVVSYDIDTPYDAKIHYIGQGARELQLVALQALKEIGIDGFAALTRNAENGYGIQESDQYLNSLVDLRKILQDRFGINTNCGPIYPNNDYDRDWLTKVADQLAELTTSPAPSQPPHRTLPASGGR